MHWKYEQNNLFPLQWDTMFMSVGDWGTNMLFDYDFFSYSRFVRGD